LKVSVFNDDKKTDLIGEAYVSLQDLIKPGGGSNDLWHQLNYKGKYAGEIRMEMTYYDIRPREIIKFTGCKVMGFNNNDYQIERSLHYAKKQGLQDKWAATTKLTK
jgi:hypothetical protein